jgi:hypothetical protein
MPLSLKKKTQSEELDEKKKEAISDSMGMKKGGMAMKKNAGFMAMMKQKAGDKPMKKMANGGMTSMGKVKTAAPSRDGVATKGKTKGTMVKMAGNNNGLKAGGMAKMNKGGRTC